MTFASNSSGCGPISPLSFRLLRMQSLQVCFLLLYKHCHQHFGFTLSMSSLLYWYMRLNFILQIRGHRIRWWTASKSLQTKGSRNYQGFANWTLVCLRYQINILLLSNFSSSIHSGGFVAGGIENEDRMLLPTLKYIKVHNIDAHHE